MIFFIGANYIVHWRYLNLKLVSFFSIFINSLYISVVIHHIPNYICSTSYKNEIYVGVISLASVRVDVMIFQNLIFKLKASVSVKILAINFRQFGGRFSDGVIHIPKFEGQSKDNNCPLILVRMVVEKPLVQRGYMKLNIAADPSRNGGDTESSGAGNETVKGQ